MTARASLRKADLRRACEVAQDTGCAIEIANGDTVWRIVPAGMAEALLPEARKKLVDMSDDIRM